MQHFNSLATLKAFALTADGPLSGLVDGGLRPSWQAPSTQAYTAMAFEGTVITLLLGIILFDVLVEVE